MTIAIAVKSLSRLNLTLDSMFMLSFHLIAAARMDGKTPTKVFSSSIMPSTDISASASNMSVAPFSFVSHIFQQGHNPVAEVALNGDFAVLCTAAYSTFDLKCTAKFCEIL